MFKNLVAFVTGGAGGLGRATATRFVNKGSKVVFCDLPTSDGAAVAKEMGENAHFIPADVTSETEIQSVLDEISSMHGKLDVVVNCAGSANAYQIYSANRKQTRTMYDFQRIISANLVGTFNVSRLAAGLIGKNTPDQNGLRGVIINTSGVEAFNPTVGQGATAASSGGIHSMTIPLAADLREAGIRVVCIAPGLMNTRLCEKYPLEVEEIIAEECVILPNRLGHPDEFAHVVQSIVANPYINATTIEVSAGLNINM